MAPTSTKKKPGSLPATSSTAKPATKPAKDSGGKRPVTTKDNTTTKDKSPRPGRTPSAARDSGRSTARSGSAGSSANRSTSARTRGASSPPVPQSVSRALMAFDDDDVLPSGGSGGGGGFGRCGGRMLSSHVERLLCDLLSRDGVAHSHSPRHFEVKLGDDTMAAYAPMIVVRGRGREGKTIVIEALDQNEPALLDKVRAFRKLYGLEFYVSFVGSEELLDEIPLDAYDESIVVQNAPALVSRLAD